MHNQHRPTFGVRNDDDGYALLFSWRKSKGWIDTAKFLFSGFIDWKLLLSEIKKM